MPASLPRLFGCCFAVWILAIASLAATVTVVSADPFKVDASALNIRDAPKNGSVVGKLSDGDVVEVYKMTDGWARISAEDEKPRWVSLNYLVQMKSPTEPSRRDPRIASAAIPEPGQYGLTEDDVELLWAGATRLLDERHCSKIVYAAKSLTQKDTYFFNCGEQSFFLTPKEIDG